MIQSSNSSATAYSLKWAKPQVNDFSSSDWVAGRWVHGSEGSSRYQIFSSAGVPNWRPVGWSDTPIFVVSTLTVMKTESPMASSPTPGTNCGSVMVSVRNGWTALSMLLV